MGLFGFLKRKQQQEDRYDPLQNEPRGPEEQRQRLIEEGYLPPDKIEEPPTANEPIEEVTFKFKGVLSNRTLTIFLSNGDILVNNDVSRE